MCVPALAVCGTKSERNDCFARATAVVSGARAFAAWTVRIASPAGAIAALWQIPRFLRGDIGLPGLDQAFASLSMEPAWLSINDTPFAPLLYLCGVMVGVVYWIVIAFYLLWGGSICASAIEKGWNEWSRRFVASAAEAAKRERIARFKFLRRQAEAARQGGAGVFALIAGALIGFWLT